LEDDDSDFSFRLAMSACMSFIIWTTSARVGSTMLMEAEERVGDAAVDGGVVAGVWVVEVSVGRE
jgi:hypothetical protein